MSEVYNKHIFSDSYRILQAAVASMECDLVNWEPLEWYGTKIDIDKLLKGFSSEKKALAETILEDTRSRVMTKDNYIHGDYNWFRGYQNNLYHSTSKDREGALIEKKPVVIILDFPSAGAYYCYPTYAGAPIRVNREVTNSLRASPSVLRRELTKLESKKGGKLDCHVLFLDAVYTPTVLDISEFKPYPLGQKFASSGNIESIFEKNKDAIHSVLQRFYRTHVIGSKVFDPDGAAEARRWKNEIQSWGEKGLRNKRDYMVGLMDSSGWFDIREKEEILESENAPYAKYRDVLDMEWRGFLKECNALVKRILRYRVKDHLEALVEDDGQVFMHVLKKDLDNFGLCKTPEAFEKKFGDKYTPIYTNPTDTSDKEKIVSEGPGMNVSRLMNLLKKNVPDKYWISENKSLYDVV